MDDGSDKYVRKGTLLVRGKTSLGTNKWKPKSCILLENGSFLFYAADGKVHLLERFFLRSSNVRSFFVLFGLFPYVFNLLFCAYYSISRVHRDPNHRTLAPFHCAEAATTFQ
jgi:hypothetical protein